MSDSELLRTFVDQYELEVEGVKFWTPYYISERREKVEGEPIVGPFKGRGTPEEILGYLLDQLDTTRFRSGEEYRAYMSSLRLGVECSGFAYYVLDSWLASKGVILAKNLFKSREEMLDVYDNPKLTPPKGLTREQVESYGTWVDLLQIQEDWGNQPKRIIQSQTFWNDGSSKEVGLSDLRGGDLIGMMGYDGIGHHLVVISNDGRTIQYAHSGGPHGIKGYFGGVEYGEIEITDPHKPIIEQDWSENGQLILDTHKDFVTRRLKVMDGA